MQILFDKIEGIAFTSDIDWAPEEVIKYTLDIFESYGIKCTFFCTHPSDVLQKCNRQLFELGIHPNFNNLLDGNGTEGGAIKIMDDLISIYPEAKGVRSHAMTQSSYLLNLFAQKGMLYDANHFLPYQTNIYPYRLWNGMIKIPYNWEDDIHWWYGYDFSETNLDLQQSGLKVFDFHPIHVFLNTESQNRYNEAKACYHNPKKLLEFRNKGIGTATLLRKLCENISKSYKHFTLSEITQNIYETYCFNR